MMRLVTEAVAQVRRGRPTRARLTVATLPASAPTHLRAKPCPTCAGTGKAGPNPSPVTE